MSDSIIQRNEDLIKHDLKYLVCSNMEENLNVLSDKEADELVMPRDMSVMVTVRVTATDIINGTSKPLPETWS